MKVGDLVRYKAEADWPDGFSVGIIVRFTHVFCSGGGGAWPSSETHAIVSWSSNKRIWITNEREESLEAINESR